MTKLKIEIWQYEGGNITMDVVDYDKKVRIPIEFTKEEAEGAGENGVTPLWLTKKLIELTRKGIEKATA